MNTLHAIGIAILQGATELFPISSLGHAVVVPPLLGWEVNQRSDAFLPFLVLLHFGTAAVLLGYFWRDWLALGLGILGIGAGQPGGAQRVAEARRLFLLIVVATIPAIVLGYGLNKFFRTLFASPVIAAGFLVCNGLMLLLAEWLRNRVRRRTAKPLTALTPLDALVIGVLQCGALLPGISRSGATIAGGLLRGLNHESSARFSFLIALPIILGATVLEVPHLLHASVPPGTFSQAALAAVVAGLVALLTIIVMMRLFRYNDETALHPFAYYCIGLGLTGIAMLGDLL